MISFMSYTKRLGVQFRFFDNTEVKAFVAHPEPLEPDPIDNVFKYLNVRPVESRSGRTSSRTFRTRETTHMLPGWKRILISLVSFLNILLSVGLGFHLAAGCRQQQQQQRRRLAGSRTLNPFHYALLTVSRRFGRFGATMERTKSRAGTVSRCTDTE